MYVYKYMQCLYTWEIHKIACVYIYLHIIKFLHLHMCTCIHTYIHTHVYIYIYKYIYTYIDWVRGLTDAVVWVHTLSVSLSLCLSRFIGVFLFLCVCACVCCCFCCFCFLSLSLSTCLWDSHNSRWVRVQKCVGTPGIPPDLETSSPLVRRSAKKPSTRTLMVFRVWWGISWPHVRLSQVRESGSGFSRLGFAC